MSASTSECNPSDAIEALFKAADTNIDGTLDRPEVLKFFNLLGETIEDGPEFDAAFNAIDVDGNGKVSFSEFMAVAGQLFEPEDLFKVARIRQIFLKYDKDGNEKLDHEEIKQVFKECEGEDMTEEQLGNFIAMAKENATSEEKALPGAEDVVFWHDFLRAAARNFKQFENYHIAKGKLKSNA